MIEFDTKVLEPNTTVHCTTEEQAKALLNWAHGRGLKWCNGESYMEINNMQYYRENTRYSLHTGTYGNIPKQTDIPYHKALSTKNCTTELVGRVLRLTFPGYTRLLTITSNTEIEYTDTTLTIDGISIHDYSKGITDEIIKLLNNSKELH